MPKKLIRTGVTLKLEHNEVEIIDNKEELNKLFALKVKEELAEIQASDHKDISEFADLYQVVRDFAKANGFDIVELSQAAVAKTVEKGEFEGYALNNLNPENPSNALYFEENQITIAHLKAEKEELEENIAILLQENKDFVEGKIQKLNEDTIQRLKDSAKRDRIIIEERNENIRELESEVSRLIEGSGVVKLKSDNTFLTTKLEQLKDVSQHGFQTIKEMILEKGCNGNAERISNIVWKQAEFFSNLDLTKRDIETEETDDEDDSDP